MKPLLGSKDSTPAEKLSLLRKELGGARIGGKEWKVGEGNQYVRKTGDEEEEEEDYESEDETPLPMPRMVGENREKWDVETVLCEYSKLAEVVLSLEFSQSTYHFRSCPSNHFPLHQLPERMQRIIRGFFH